MAGKKKRSGGARPGAGAPRAEIDIDQIEKLCMLDCTDDDLAGQFSVSLQTIHRLKENPEVLAAMERGRAKGRVSLRRLQYVAAQNGNTAMLIFLGKTRLGQKETLTIEDKRVPAAIRYGWVAETPKQIEKAETEPITAEFVDIDDHKVQ
jgi:hypothetical protein